MTREEAIAILQHLDVVEHYANGGDVEWRIGDEWYRSSRMNLCCLKTGNYRIKPNAPKPRYRLWNNGHMEKVQ